MKPDPSLSSFLAREATLRRLRDLCAPSGSRPDEVLDAGEFSPVDEELARLVYDSAHDPTALAGVRGLQAGTRRLSFEGAHLGLEVELTCGRPRSLLCQVVPHQAAELQLNGARGLSLRQREEDGTFQVRSIPPGPLRLRCRADGSPYLSTSWFLA